MAIKLKVNANNEYRFIPDIGDNLKLPDSDKFVVVLKRMSIALNASNWIHYKSDGSMEPDIRAKLRDHIIRFENPLLLDDGGKQIDLTIDILLSDKYTALDDLLGQIIDKINEISSKGRTGIEIKKS
jgi:hypothetical protein